MNGTPVTFELNRGALDRFSHRLRLVDDVPAAKITSRTRVAGVDAIYGDGRWWKFTMWIDGPKWRYVIIIDDGQHSHAEGTAPTGSSRARVEADAREAMTEKMVSWAEARTRSRRCRHAVPPNALANYRHPASHSAPPFSWWRRFLLLFRSEMPK